MSSKAFVLETMRQQGRVSALALQEKSSTMTGTELNAQNDYIPRFTEAVKVKNMLDRKAGQDDGFVCKSSVGRVVRLIQNYDSDTYPQEPEELPAQWGFVWSQDPAKALSFISLATSPYNTGDCCTFGGQTFRSAMEGNVWSPQDYPNGWEAVSV